MMPGTPIRHVDAFTSVPLEGNPAAVVDGDGLAPETMQRIALNQRLSETVFLLPPASSANDARLRIFTPRRELPFAGHPVVAAAHIINTERHAGKARRLLLETGAGVIPVDVEPGEPPRYTMTQARPEFRRAGADEATAAASVGLAAADVLRVEDVSTGIFWTVAQLASPDAMRRVAPDMAALARFPMGLAVFCISAGSQDADIHVRVFAPAAGVDEDPVTGSGNGCIGAFIAKHGLLPARDGEIRYVAAQGAEIGQPGRVYVRVTGAPNAGGLTVQVGGHAVTAMAGDLLLPGG